LKVRGTLEISLSLPLSINTCSFPKVHTPFTAHFNECPVYPNLTPVNSPIYSSYKPGETSSLHLGPSFSNFLCLDDQFPTTFLSHSSTTPVLISNLSMAAHRGAGDGGGVVGGVIGGQVSLPGFFAKVAARYTPLVLLVPLHDLLENYMKNLPKFIGEGDLTTREHIIFFDQFVNILGLEQEDVYSRLLVETFEGQVRT
jgi:hypothetical protein